MRTPRGFGAWWCPILVAALVPCAASALEGPDPQSFPLLDGARALPDTQGAIAQVLLHYDLTMQDHLGPAYRDLFEALPQDVRLQVICSSFEAVVDFLADWGEAAMGDAREVVLINAGCEISPWARDRRIARYHAVGGRPAASLVPGPSDDYTDWQLNELDLPLLLESTDLAGGVLSTPLCIEGGQVVANVQHVFISHDVLLENAAVDRPQEELERILGRPLVIIANPGGPGVWHHLDMYLTPVDERTVLLASPSFAVNLLSPSPPLHTVDTSMSPPLLKIKAAAGGSDALLSCTRQALLAQPDLDSIADQLRELGYTVLRLPVVVNEADEWLMTYNNVLMEQRGERRIVYMPIYHVPALDSVAAAIYRGLGFEVRTIDVSRLYAWGGAVRCIANVIARRPSTVDPNPILQERDGSIHVLNLARRETRAIWTPAR